MPATPDWIVTNLDATAAPSLANFRGKPTLLLFFNLGCLGCMSRGVPLAQDLANAYPDLNVVGIHSNFGRAYTGEEVQAQLDAIGITYPVLMDAEHRTYDSYQAEGTPHWVLLDAEGQVQKSIFGSQPNAQQRLTYGMLELFGDD